MSLAPFQLIIGACCLIVSFTDKVDAIGALIGAVNLLCGFPWLGRKLARLTQS